jgi:Na+-transporting methylmalonyl-CoA/oxaloacetate decarboxylase gamma subunit
MLNISGFEQVLLYSVIGVTVVFSALVILVFAFKFTGNLSRGNYSLKKRIKKTQLASTETETVQEEKEITGQEIAAISMALHLFLSDIHDEESNIITIKRIERRYSPWNSKIYGLTNLIR